MRLTFMKLPEIRQFDLKPRYYDENKEELKAIVENAHRELGIKTENSEEEIEGARHSANIRGAFARNRKQNHVEMAREGKRKSNIRTFVIIAFLLIVFYLGYAKSMELAMLIVK